MLRFSQIRAHLCCFCVALAFMFLWPVLAIRDAFKLGDVLTTQVSGAIYGALWLVAGALALIETARHKVKLSGLGVSGLTLFAGIWFVNVAVYPISLPHESVYPAYALTSCVAPFIVGLLLPEHYLSTLAKYVCVGGVVLCGVLSTVYVTNPVASHLERNWQFASINPITQAAHLASGLICLICSSVFKMPSALRLLIIAACAWQILLTGSRGPIIGVMIALVWIAIKSNTLSLSRRIWTSATLIAALMGAVALQNYLPVDSQMRLMNIDYSLNAPVVQGGALGRIEPIETALKLGMESPLFGSGLSLNATMGFYSHNLFSQAFLETGLVGVSGLVMVIISAFKGYLRRRAYTDGQVDFLGSMFVVYCVIHQFSFTAVLGLQFWLLAGIGSRLMGEGRQVASWSGSLVRRRRVHYAPLWAGLKQAL